MQRGFAQFIKQASIGQGPFTDDVLARIGSALNKYAALDESLKGTALLQCGIAAESWGHASPMLPKADR